MNWTLSDFITFGGMIAGAGGLIALVMFASRNAAYRAGVVLAALTAFLLVFANGAVGIVGSEDNNANLMYYAALLVPVGGALIARFKARGMANAMFATTGALLLAGAVAVTLRLGAGTEENWLRGIAIGSLGFGAMFAGSGWLFLQAAKSARITA